MYKWRYDKEKLNGEKDTERAVGELERERR